MLGRWLVTGESITDGVTKGGGVNDIFERHRSKTCLELTSIVGECCFIVPFLCIVPGRPGERFSKTKIVSKRRTKLHLGTETLGLCVP